MYREVGKTPPRMVEAALHTEHKFKFKLPAVKHSGLVYSLSIKHEATSSLLLYRKASTIQLHLVGQLPTLQVSSYCTRLSEVDSCQTFKGKLKWTSCTDNFVCVVGSQAAFPLKPFLSNIWGSFLYFALLWCLLSSLTFHSRPESASHVLCMLTRAGEKKIYLYMCM